MRPLGSSAFHTIPTRGFLEETWSSNQFSGSPFLLVPSAIRVPLLFSLFPPFFHASTVLSLVVGSILCRARLDWTQIMYRRFRFNIGSHKRKKKKENKKRRVSWLIAMTSGLGQQQFNLSNLSAREHLLRFQIFISLRFRGKERPRIPSAARYVDCSSRTFREAAIYLESYPGSFIVSGQGDVSCYRFRSATLENFRQVIVRTVLHFLQSFLALWLSFQQLLDWISIRRVHSRIHFSKTIIHVYVLSIRFLTLFFVILIILKTPHTQDKMKFVMFNL